MQMPTARSNGVEGTGSAVVDDRMEQPFAATDLGQVAFLQVQGRMLSFMGPVCADCKKCRKTRIVVNSEQHQRRDSARFLHAMRRLRWTWLIGVAMTMILFVLLVSMAVVAAVSAVRTGSSAWTLVTGGVSALPFLTLVIWKPYEKTFEAAARVQRLEMILVFYEDQRQVCMLISDPVARAIQLSRAQQEAYREIERAVSPESASKVELGTATQSKARQ